MSVFIDKNTKVMVQGITGSTALFHTKQMLDYGTQIVAGVTPGKGGQVVEGVQYITLLKKLKMKQELMYLLYTYQHHSLLIQLLKQLMPI